MNLRQIFKEMTNFMHPNNSIDDPDPWDDSAFTRLDTLTGASDDKRDLTRENATKIRQKTLRAGSINTDEAVEPAMRVLGEYHNPAVFYYQYCGPTAATAEDLVWNTAFRLDPASAVRANSDEWKKIASEFRIPDTRAYQLVPEKILACYRTLEEYTERNDCPRYVHPEELRTVGPTVADSAAETAFEHLGDFPGVTPPDLDKPAWETTTDATAESEASTDTETHAD